jgi:hypothetical protein
MRVAKRAILAVIVALASVERAAADPAMDAVLAWVAYQNRPILCNYLIGQETKGVNVCLFGECICTEEVTYPTAVLSCADWSDPRCSCHPVSRYCDRLDALLPVGDPFECPAECR